MNKFYIVLFFFCICFSTLHAKSIYVSTTGVDTNPGTIDQPLKTITKALASSIHPGDSIIVRGGVYSLTSTISINPSGVQNTLYYLFAYPGERPILDFSAMADPVLCGPRFGEGEHSRQVRSGFVVWRRTLRQANGQRQAFQPGQVYRSVLVLSFGHQGCSQD